MRIDTKEMQFDLLNGIDSIAASAKRAMNSTNSPKFRALHQEDLDRYNALRVLVAAAEIGPDELIKAPTKK